MADIVSTDVAGPIDKGLLEDETIGYSAVAKLAGLRKISFGERQIWHRIETSRGAVVAEGGTKPNTGAQVKELEVIASKIVRDYSYSMEAMERKPELFEKLVEVQSKELANDFDHVVLGVLPAVGGNLDTFATGVTEKEIADQGDFWDALGTTSRFGGENGLLLTPSMYTALRKQVNQGGNPQHLFEGDMNEGRINGVHYVTVWGVSEAIGILGPWKNRSIATLGDAKSLKNPFGVGWRQNETEAFVEIAAGFKVVDKADFLKLVVPAEEVTP